VSTVHALRGFQEGAISLLLLFDVTRYTFKVAPQTDTFLKAAIIAALFRGALNGYLRNFLGLAFMTYLSFVSVC
jgi:hypothetical protein